MTSNIDIPMVTRRELENDLLSAQYVEQARIMEMLYRLETAVGNAHAGEVREGDWNYIPFSHLMFYRALKEAVRGKNAADLRYLELGCGLGTKLMIAHGWVGIGAATGIEIVPAFAAIARRMLGDAAAILETDLRTFDRYQDYDIVYSYENYGPPVPADVREFIQKVKDGMKPGAVLLQGGFSRATRPLTTIQVWEKPLPP
jgi:SAM-dependent methyltransferase